MLRRLAYIQCSFSSICPQDCPSEASTSMPEHRLRSSRHSRHHDPDTRTRTHRHHSARAANTRENRTQRDSPLEEQSDTCASQDSEARHGQAQSDSHTALHLAPVDQDNAGSSLASSSSIVVQSDEPSHRHRSSDRRGHREHSGRTPPVPIYSPTQGGWVVSPRSPLPDAREARDSPPRSVPTSSTAASSGPSQRHRRLILAPTDAIRPSSGRSNNTIIFDDPSQGRALTDGGAAMLSPTGDGSYNSSSYAQGYGAPDQGRTVRNMLGAADFAPRVPGGAVPTLQPTREEYWIPRNNAQLLRHGNTWFLNGRAVPAPSQIDQVFNYRDPRMLSGSPLASPTYPPVSPVAPPLIRPTVSDQSTTPCPAPASRERTHKRRRRRTHSEEPSATASSSGETAVSSPAADSPGSSVTVGPSIRGSERGSAWLESPDDWNGLFEYGQRVAHGGTGLLGWPRN